MSDADALVLVPPELENGFLLAGVRTVVVTSAGDAGTRIGELLSEGAEGVVAVHEPYLVDVDPDLRHRAEGSLTPVIVPLPPGIGAVDPATRRARLSDLLGRAVGYHITFGGEEEA